MGEAFLGKATLSNTSNTATQKTHTFFDHIAKSSSVAGVLGHGLAKVVALASPVIDNKLQVMYCDGTTNSIPQRLDHVDCSLSSSMLQDDLELGECQMNVLEVAQELFLGIHHAHILNSG